MFKNQRFRICFLTKCCLQTSEKNCFRVHNEQFLAIMHELSSRFGKLI